MKKFDINELLGMANEINDDFVVASLSGQYSLGIVNSFNGKRLSFSKALSQKLGLTDKVYIIPVPAKNVVMISAQPLNDKSSVGTLNKAEKKICYSSALVAMLSAAFKLDYSIRTSISFFDVCFETINGTEVAIVNMAAKQYEKDNVDIDTEKDNEAVS
jgi:hypothetical protein